MKKSPTPLLMALAAFCSATSTGLLERWVSWFSGWQIQPESVFAGMMLSAGIGAIVAGFSRTQL